MTKYENLSYIAFLNIYYRKKAYSVCPYNVIFMGLVGLKIKKTLLHIYSQKRNASYYEGVVIDVSKLFKGFDFFTLSEENISRIFMTASSRKVCCT